MLTARKKIEDGNLTIAVRPPAYFPGLPYVALLQQADCFVLADTFEFSRRSLQNRARLRTPQGAQWITVPVHGGQTHRRVAEVEIDNGAGDGTTGGAHWRSRHWRAMQYDYRSTPYFELYEPVLAPFFEQAWQRLGPCACASVEWLAARAGIATDVRRATQLPGTPGTLPAVLAAVLQSLGAGETAGEAATVEATVLVPPEAAAHDAALLEDTGCDVCTMAYDAPRYRQNFDGFEAGLSFVDVLFGYGPEAQALLATGASVRTVA